MGKLLTWPTPEEDLPPLHLWMLMLGGTSSDDDLRRVYAIALEATAHDRKWKQHLSMAEAALRSRDLEFQ